MEIGDIRVELPTVDSEIMLSGRKPQRGVVVYIHPDYRFYVVEFETERGYRFRETFYFQDRAPGGPPLPEHLRDRMLSGKDKSRGYFTAHWSNAVRGEALYK